MSNDVAYPILRSPDRAEALRVAREMVAVGLQPDSYVTVEAEAHTLDELKRLRDELPDAWVICWDDRGVPATPPPGLPDLTHPLRAHELPDDLTGAEPYLPLAFSLREQPVGSVEDHFLHAAGASPAELLWECLVWPEALEDEVYGEGTHAEVTLVLNNDSRGLDVPADTHLVLVHVRRTHTHDGRMPYSEHHAKWLAERIGRKIIGPPQGT
ncbi:hypothetical protein [Streptomyces tanashiensis]|uniref:Uncharacterized protein n=1 Tax=Streptomyces tanashiensis TaxID=67367 RepID=A0ABY6R0L7_9ACTN|nr:hypothetical protein [Streptomyces tanashiensis]UZX23580.1 hypothetical protein LDH80_23950 [Streptomyces tanashiensis]GGY38934.1 hypothetical protein GCM10010299_51460 [Streptomyces tanashiensis]